MQDNPDGIMLTNGPGDPKECTEVIEEPQNTVCFGYSDFCHLPWTSAHGTCQWSCDTEKMKYGHRGANHPVKDLETRKSLHFFPEPWIYGKRRYRSLQMIAEVAFVNVNDGTVEGLRYKNKNIFTVQFHPEACAGPKDSEVLFDRFIKMMEE